MGRRGVQQLTAAEWREALELQIREKKQQREKGRSENDVELQRRSQSPLRQAEGIGERDCSVPGLVQTATTTNCDVDSNQVAGRRRRFQPVPQSQEEYRKGLQEQIEEKKRMIRVNQENEQLRQCRMSRTGDEEDKGRRESWRDEDRQDESIEKVDGNNKTCVRTMQDEISTSGALNQQEDESCQITRLKSEVAADPAAITKIVDFCEELKKQNEDVKRQLIEQHTVLTSLYSTLATEAKDSRLLAASQRPNSDGIVRELRGQLKQDAASGIAKRLQSKRSQVKPALVVPIAPRPRPMRGETKIPFPRTMTAFSVQSVSADTVQKDVPKGVTQEQSSLHKAESKDDPCDLNDDCTLNEEQTNLRDTGGNRLMMEEALPSVKAIAVGSSDDQDADKLCPSKLEAKARKDHSTNSCKVATSSCNVAESGYCREMAKDLLDEDERPMVAESKLLLNWKVEEEMLKCSSISVLDGPSSLIPLDQSPSQLF